MLKKVFCGKGNCLKKVAEWFVTAIKTTKITIDVREYDEFETYCWCCTFWRGVFIGSFFGSVIGLVVGYFQ